MWFKNICKSIREKIQPSDVSVLIGMIFIVAFMLSRQLIALGENIEEGTAVIFQNEVRPAVQITDFAVTQDNTYVYYDARGLVGVYDSTGKYCYSIQIHKYANGIGKIGFNGDYLVIQDRYSNIYIFDGASQLSYFPVGDEVDISENCFNTGESGYQCRGGQIYDLSNNTVLLDLSDAFWKHTIGYGLLVILVCAAFFVMKKSRNMKRG